MSAFSRRDFLVTLSAAGLAPGAFAQSRDGANPGSDDDYCFFTRFAICDNLRCDLLHPHFSDHHELPEMIRRVVSCVRVIAVRITWRSTSAAWLR